MNECPFCGMHLNCNSNHTWICENCGNVWIRAQASLNLISEAIDSTPNYEIRKISN